MHDWRKYFLLRILISALFGIGVGVGCLLLRPYAGEIFDILVIAMGLLTVLLNLPMLVRTAKYLKTRDGIISFVLTLCAILLGVSLMLARQQFILLLLGAYCILLPVLRIVTAPRRKLQLRRELPTILTGAVMFLIFAASMEEFVFLIAAIICFVLTGLYLLWGLFSYWTIGKHHKS